MKNNQPQTGAADKQPQQVLDQTQLEAAYLFNAIHTDFRSHLRTIRALAKAEDKPAKVHISYAWPILPEEVAHLAGRKRLASAFIEAH